MVTITRLPNSAVVELGPCYDSLNRESVEELRKLVAAEISSVASPQIILDLSKTAYIGSAFIETLIQVWKRVVERGGSMVLCGVDPLCAEVLKISRLDTIWPILPDQGQAVRSFVPAAHENSPANMPS